MSKSESTTCYCGNDVSLDVNVFNNEDDYSCRIFCEDCELSTPHFRACNLEDAREKAFLAWPLIVAVVNNNSSELF